VGGGGGGGGGGFGGATGLLRLLHPEFGGQVTWLLPAALITLAAMLWASRRAARTDRTRAAALLWGGWVIVTGLVFSYMSGIIHPYYMVALAPGIGALVGVGATALIGGAREGFADRPPGAAPWAARLGAGGPAAAAAAVVITAVWAFILLGRTPQWLPWLRWVILMAGVLAGCWVAAGRRLAGRTWLRSRRGRLALVVVPFGLALVAGLAGPAAYALDTVTTTHTGAIPSSGPQTAGFGGGPGGVAGPGTQPGGGGGAGFSGNQAGQAGPAGGAGSTGGFPGGASGLSGSGAIGAGAAGGTGASGSAGTAGGPGSAGTAGGPGGAVAGGGGPGGGLGGSTKVSSALVKLVGQHASRYRWVAATEGSEAAAPLELATGDAVMAIGGFNGTDPWPTLAAFEKLVASHEVHYYIGQGTESFGGGRGSSAIAAWVAAHFKKLTVGGETVYDLTQPISGTVLSDTG